jgi:hypothetical protein
MMPAPRIIDVLHRVTFADGWESHRSQVLRRLVLSRYGKAGELAKARVIEGDVRGLELVEYRPFPVHTFASERPKPGFKVQWHLRRI